MKKQKDKLHIAVLCSGSETDFFVARNICRKLNRYRTPSLIEKKVRFEARICCFDIEIVANALLQARNYPDWLIVVCSPKLKDDGKNKRFVEGFISQKGFDHVIMCISEGEPGEVFFDSLLQRETVSTLADGSIVISKEEVEPLAADFRAENNVIRKQIIKNNYLKLVSTILAVRYDDLKQRRKMNNRARRTRMIQVLASIYIALIIVFMVMIVRVTDVSQDKKLDAMSYADELIDAARLNIINGDTKAGLECIHKAMKLGEKYELFDEKSNIIGVDSLYELMYACFPYEPDWTLADDEPPELPKNDAGYECKIYSDEDNSYVLSSVCEQFTTNDDGWRVSQILRITNSEFNNTRALFTYPNGNYKCAIPGVVKDDNKKNKYGWTLKDGFSIEEGAEPIDTFITLDKDGVLYFKGGDKGYIIGPGGTLLGTVDYLYAVDLEQEQLILKKDDLYLRIDILTSEKMVELLKEMMAKYEIEY